MGRPTAKPYVGPIRGYQTAPDPGAPTTESVDAPESILCGPSEGVMRSPEAATQTELPTLLIMFESVPPRKIRETIATIAIRRG